MSLFRQRMSCIPLMRSVVRPRAGGVLLDNAKVPVDSCLRPAAYLETLGEDAGFAAGTRVCPPRALVPTAQDRIQCSGLLRALQSDPTYVPEFNARFPEVSLQGI
jgi:hypothetical protein